MTCFGKDYWADYDTVLTIDRGELIESLLSIVNSNESLKFTREFLEEYPTSKLRHILHDAVNETFWLQWEKEERKAMDDEHSSCTCSESSGD